MAFQIPNLIQWNTWDRRKFLLAIAIFQISLWGTVGLDILGIKIPFLRQLLGLIFLSYIPGIIILRILRCHNLSNIKTLIFSIALSILVVYGVGFVAIQLFPHFGISQPLSEMPLLTLLSLVQIILCVVCYLLENEPNKNLGRVYVLDHLSLIFAIFLVPFMAVIGTYLVNYYQCNFLLLLMFATILVTGAYLCFKPTVSNNLYPIWILAISISLILHRTLITDYVQAYDVIFEYYVASNIIADSNWLPNSMYYLQYSSVLSVTIAPAVYSTICNLTLEEIYKICFPMILSIIPLGIYHVANQFINEKRAFLSAFIFISLRDFYTQIPFISKQIFAELFFICIILVLYGKRTHIHEQSLLLIIFSIGMIVSHYGTTYFFASALVFTLLGSQMIYVIFSKNTNNIFINSTNFSLYTDNNGGRKIDLKFVLFFIIFTFVWYIYSSISANYSFFTTVEWLDVICKNVFTEFADSGSSRGAYLLTQAPRSALTAIYKLLFIFLGAFVTLGILHTVLHRSKSMKIDGDYLIMSIFTIFILGASIIVSNFAVMNPGRLFHISLMLTAPFAVIGGIGFFYFLLCCVLRLEQKSSKNIAEILFCVFGLIFLIFNSGLVFELVNEHPHSISLSQNSIRQYGDISDRGGLFATITTEFDVSGARWLGSYYNLCPESMTYGTLGYGQGLLPLMAYGNIPYSNIRELDVYDLPGNSYIFLYSFNVLENIYLASDRYGLSLYFSEFSLIDPRVWGHDHTIYNNGGSIILVSTDAGV